MNKQLKYILLSLLLTIPVLLVYLPHFMAGTGDSGKIPSGFLMYDAPYYMANARELTDDGGFHLMYSNPFSHNYQSDRIYFQVHTLVLGAILKLTGIDPGLLMFIFGLICSVLFFWVIIKIFQYLHLLEKKRDYLILLLFCWGGGIFSLSGFTMELLHGQSATAAFMGSSLFEPSGGWWFLNPGRNLILPTEAFYHLVFFFCILMALKKRFIAALCAALLMSVSHPFTGIELLVILLAWTSLEILISRARYRPLLWFGAGLVLILTWHIWYYLYFLRHNPEHELLFGQWTLAWNLSTMSIILAYGLLFILVLYRLFNMKFSEGFRSNPPTRLFVVWFLAAFLLSNHDLFIKPIQPLHFTRGYIWSALFLLAIPVLQTMFDFIGKHFRNHRLRQFLTVIIVFVLLSDNLFWLSTTAIQSARNHDLFLSKSEVELYRELNKEEYRGRLIVSTDLQVGYRVTVYTPLRSWYSHSFNTPDNKKCMQQINSLSDKGIVADEMMSKNPLLIFPTSRIPDTVNTRFRTIWRNNYYSLLSF